MKFGLKRPNGFRNVVWKGLTTDDRLRQWTTAYSISSLGTFGSIKLKSIKTNIMYNSMKSQPHTTYGFWGVFFPIFRILVSMATNENEQWVNNHMYDTRLVKEHFCNILSKYLQCLDSKCHFSIFPIISLKNLSCHGNQTKEIIFIKT